MKLFTSELQYLSELYSRLHRELESPLKAGETTALTEAILRNRELFTRIDQMNGRLFQLAREWDNFRGDLAPATSSAVKALAESVKKQAAELSALMEQRNRQLTDGCRKLENTLGEIRRGARYLASVKPPKTNYPKFVDSVG